MHENESKLLLQHLDGIPAGRALVVGLWGSAVPDALRARGDEVVTFHAHLRGARSAGPDGAPAAWLEDPGPFDGAIVAAPKETERLRMWLSMSRAASAAVVVVVGQNDAGIRSAGKHIAQIVGPPEVMAYGLHRRAYRASATVPFGGSSLDDWAVTFTHAGLRVRSYPGVFAHGRADDATVLLLSTLTLDPGMRALDVGSGAGIIGAVLAHAGMMVDAVDVDALAARATTETLDLNELSARVWLSDVYSDVTDRYPLIVSNPPFHAGVRTITNVAAALISGARDHLEPGGELRIVSNRFLPYREPLQKAFRHVEIVADDGRYRVYAARRPV